MISRGQMYRQMYYGGGKGITSLDAGAPSILYKGDITSGEMRQQYGLGSIVKKAVKGVTGAVKDVVKSDIGKAALLGAAAFGIPGTQFKGLGFLSPVKQFVGGLSPFAIPGTGTGRAYDLGNLIRGGVTRLMPESLSGKVGLGLTALGGLTGYLASQGMDEQQIEEVKNRPEALKGYLAQYYSNLNPTASAEQVQNFVTSQLGEYAYAVGGRVGYSEGSPEDNEEMEEARELAEREGISLNKALGKMLEERFGRDRSPITRIKKAYGNTAQMAAGIEGLPYRENQAGVGEVDMRETGGFIPPVGVKEKADDIPAMLSNNEFVFTADAVRGMGNGNVNLGAQRMYDMMKKLEKGGRV